MQTQQVEQRWFVGAHADVGGGYANGILAQIPLKCLMQKAQQAHGLIFRDTIVIDGDEAQGEIHDFYRAIGARPVVSGDVTTSTINETINGSVFERCRSDSSYRAKNCSRGRDRETSPRFRARCARTV